MAHTVAVGEFEGPLGILLELVERGRMEVTRISVAEITAQYLDRVRGLNTHTPEELSEFLQLGARLLYIKSLALLPQASGEEQAQELAQLNLELAEYRRFQIAAAELGRRNQAGTWERRLIERPAPHELRLPRLELTMLSEAFTRALKRHEPARTPGVIRSHLSLETVSHRLKARLKQGGFDLQALLDDCRDRLEVIVTFLALLELVRDGTAQVAQTGQFAPLMVEPAHA